MSNSLVLADFNPDDSTKDVGENTFLRDLSPEYKVFAFYYPSAMRSEDLETALRGLGELTGKNVFVNIGKLNDPDFDKIAGAFELTRFPVVVLTATADLAGTSVAHVNAYIRLDNDHLLSDPARTTALLQEASTLFLRGDVADAMSKAKWTQRSEGLRSVAEVVIAGLRHLAGFIADRDIKVSIVEGTFELTKSSG